MSTFLASSICHGNNGTTQVGTLIIPIAAISFSLLLRTNVQLVAVGEFEYVLELVHTNIDRLAAYHTILVYRTNIAQIIISSVSITDVFFRITIFA